MIVLDGVRKATNFLYAFPAMLYNYHGCIWIEIRRVLVSRSVDAPALIPLNLCDFLRDPKGQL